MILLRQVTEFTDGLGCESILSIITSTQKIKNVDNVASKRPENLQLFMNVLSVKVER